MARLEEADFVFADAVDAVVTGTFLATLTFCTGIWRYSDTLTVLPVYARL